MGGLVSAGRKLFCLGGGDADRLATSRAAEFDSAAGVRLLHEGLLRFQGPFGPLFNATRYSHSKPSLRQRAQVGGSVEALHFFLETVQLWQLERSLP